MTETVAVRFTRKAAPYNAGEEAGFAPDYAEKLVRMGRAEYVRPPAPETPAEPPAPPADASGEAQGEAAGDPAGEPEGEGTGAPQGEATGRRRRGRPPKPRQTPVQG